MSTNPKLTLSYFGIAGRAEPIRFACAICDIPFTNKVVSFQEFKEVKSSLPLGQMPTLDLDFGESKKTLTQTTAILRYIGKKGGLYPKDDDMTAMEIDEILSILDDLRAPLAISVQGAVRALISDDKEFTNDEKMALRRRWREQTLPKYLGFIEKKIEQNKGSDWVVGSSISIADLVLYCDLNWVSSGILDGVPTDVLDAYPECKKLMESVKNHDGVKKWTDKYSKPYETFDYQPLN